METIGERIARLRAPTGWSLAELGSRMAKAIGREKPFSGEAIRRYEANIDIPGPEPRRALAKVFDRSEAFIQFGVTSEADSKTARQPPAAYAVSRAALEIAREFDQLSPVCQDHVRRQIELLRGRDANQSGHRRAVQQDVEIKQGALRPRSKTRKGVR